MDIDAIAVFVKVVETGSFSGAARVLKMPKTTVSTKIAALERRLGVTLIQRTTRTLHITEAGQTYFRHCVLAIKEIELGEASLLAARDHPSGRIRITTPVDIGHSLLPKLVCDFLDTYPETEVEMVVTNRIVDLVGEGIDLAIRVGELKDSTLMAKKFFEMDIGFYATPAYLEKQGTPRHAMDIPQHEIIMHPAMRTRSSELSDGRIIAALNPYCRIKTDDIETIKAMTLLSQGIGCIPAFLVAGEIKSRRLVKVLEKWKHAQSGHYYFVYPGQKYSAPNVKAFMELAIGAMNKR